MNPRDYEILLSDWLDQPHDANLQSEVEHAARHNPGLARLRDEWIRLNTLVNRTTSLPVQLDWDALRNDTLHRINEHTTSNLSHHDQTLENLDPWNAVANTIDWSTLRTGINRALDARLAPKRQTIRFPRVAAAILAAAALWALVALYPHTSADAPHTRGAAHVRIVPPAIATPPNAGKTHVRLTPPPGPNTEKNPQTPAHSAANHTPNTFFMLSAAGKTERCAYPEILSFH